MERRRQHNQQSRSVLALSKILTDRAGRDSSLGLRREEAELSINILDRVSFDSHLPLPPPQIVRQGIVEPNLGSAEKHNFYVVLRRLVECHRRLPDRMMITVNIEVSNVIPTFDGFVGPGMYKGLPVAVKTSRFALSRR